MIDYQKEREYEAEAEGVPAHQIATVGAVSASGITLIFPGQTTASTKKYPYNKSVTFTAGDKVYIAKARGTYIVICKI